MTCLSPPATPCYECGVPCAVDVVVQLLREKFGSDSGDLPGVWPPPPAGRIPRAEFEGKYVWSLQLSCQCSCTVETTRVQTGSVDIALLAARLLFLLDGLCDFVSRIDRMMVGSR